MLELRLPFTCLPFSKATLRTLSLAFGCTVLPAVLGVSAPWIAIANAQESTDIQTALRKAFSLVGRWEIVKMEMRLASHQVAGVATTSIDLSSNLGQFGYFDVSPTGQVTGRGQVLYQFRVEAGSTGPRVTVPALLPGLSFMTLNAGAVAMLADDESGAREFTIKGTADVLRRTIALDAFQPTGGPLRMIIRPSESKFTSVSWPPMSNIAVTEVVTAGAAIRLRAVGVLQNIHLSFEALKHVDIESILKAIR